MDGESPDSRRPRHVQVPTNEPVAGSVFPTRARTTTRREKPVPLAVLFPAPQPGLAAELSP